MNENRREFLKFILFGAGMIPLSRLVDFFDARRGEHPAPKTGGGSSASEDAKKIVFRDDTGEEILIIEK